MPPAKVFNPHNTGRDSLVWWHVSITIDRDNCKIYHQRELKDARIEMVITNCETGKTERRHMAIQDDEGPKYKTNLDWDDECHIPVVARTELSERLLPARNGIYRICGKVTHITARDGLMHGNAAQDSPQDHLDSGKYEIQFRVLRYGLNKLCKNKFILHVPQPPDENAGFKLEQVE